MTNGSLAQSYLLKATKRLKILPVLLDEEAYSDVVREAQELVELALKGVLRQVGIEPPHCGRTASCPSMATSISFQPSTTRASTPGAHSTTPSGSSRLPPG